MTEQKTEQTAMQSTTMPLTVALFMCLSVSEHDLPYWSFQAEKAAKGLSDDEIEGCKVASLQQYQTVRFFSQVVEKVFGFKGETNG